MLLGMNNGGGVSYGCSVKRPTCNEVQELSERGADGRALFRVVTSPREATNPRAQTTPPMATIAPHPRDAAKCLFVELSFNLIMYTLV